MTLTLEQLKAIMPLARRRAGVFIEPLSLAMAETGVAAFKGQQVSADALKTMVEAAVKAAALPYGGAALGTGLQLIK